MSPTLSIKGTEDIRTLAESLSLWHAERRSLEVVVPQLDVDANKQLHRRIALHYATCGCHQGRFAGIAILAVFVLLIVSGVLSWNALGIWKIDRLLLSAVLLRLAAVEDRDARAVAACVAAHGDRRSGPTKRRVVTWPKCVREIQERIEERRNELREDCRTVSRTISETICSWLPWPLDDICDLVTRVITELFARIVGSLSRS